MRALISVYDKTGLDELARGLVELGCELVASGGTAAFLEEHGLAVTRVESLTGFGEMLGHRVVTLHPAVHGGILARRDSARGPRRSRGTQIEPFDLVVVNLYPFTEVASQHGVTEEDAVEMIDIGGPALLRAAAKNFAHVVPLARPERYADVLAELREHGALSLDTRRSLAAETFAVTAAYESAIAAWFADREAFPEGLIPTFWKDRNLAYGENPHQRAAYYSEAGARRHLLSRVEQLHGRELSYNNLNDLSAARQLVEEFTLPACVIVKHANPCGVAVAGAIEDAYERALGSDPVSAYGGVVVLNRPVSPALAARLAEAVHRGALRAGLRGRRARAAEEEGGAADARVDGAPPRADGRARLPAGARRPARPGPRRATSTTARGWSSSAATRASRTGATCSSPGGSAST